MASRIAQEVVRSYLDKFVEPEFNEHSYGYRKRRNQHQAVDMATRNALKFRWAIDIDIKGFFDNIDHVLLKQAVSHYCKDKWVLMYIDRWLKAGIIAKDGQHRSRITGTPQGGVISPLLANIFLHVVFDKWMEKHHPEKPFERYADDSVVHCVSEKQARFMLSVITGRFKTCKLELHPEKTKIVNFRGESKKKYPRKLDFLGFTIRLQMVKTKEGLKLMPTNVISQKALSATLKKFRLMKIHKIRGDLFKVSRLLSSKIRGIMNYYCKFWSSHTNYLWHRLNGRLLKWVMWEKHLYIRAARKWLHKKYMEFPNLFPHWRLVHP